MRLIYDLGIRIYYLLILVASLFNPKAKQWIRGRKGLFSRIAREVDPSEPVIWFHCSSLGEFEQGRPVIELIRRERPDKKILLTFYSPSGYEIRKDYPGADHIFYLPLDTRKNVKRFLDLITIEQAFFVKYEFWYHFLSTMHHNKIPVYLISGIFRKNQVFFKWYGSWYRKILGMFDHLFLQQKSSLELLGSIGIKHASVSGDTRFDRVFEIAQDVGSNERFSTFCKNSSCVIAGSTWPADEEILCRYINESGSSVKWILVPHEIHASHIQQLKHSITKKTLIYSESGENDSPDAEVLIIDTIGLLSSLYQYGELAYIGGGFGKGIHNTLEAATFGLPVIFGPRFNKFTEAKELVQAGAAFPVHDYAELKEILNRLFKDPEMLKTSGKIASDYVSSKLGASRLIVNSTLKS